MWRGPGENAHMFCCHQLAMPPHPHRVYCIGYRVFNTCMPAMFDACASPCAGGRSMGTAGGDWCPSVATRGTCWPSIWQLEGTWWSWVRGRACRPHCCQLSAVPLPTHPPLLLLRFMLACDAAATAAAIPLSAFTPPPPPPLLAPLLLQAT